MNSTKPSSLYIHIPYCNNKCLYCDFFSGSAKIANWPQLIDSIICEAKERSNELQVIPDTLYIGGGTPSLIPAAEFYRLINGIKKVFDCNHFKEFTIEVNPEDVTFDKCNVWKECEVNRVSMGIQSFDDNELKNVGRKHTSNDSRYAFKLLNDHFDNISVDLIFGLPGQSVSSWNYTLSEVLKFGPTHISCYTLMLEEKTPLTVLYNKGKICLPSDDEVIDMWSTLITRLVNDGYEQYEISNFARPGYRSIHNTRYWRGNPYLGLGPAAHSYDGNLTRRANLTDIKKYITCYTSLTNNHSKIIQFYEEECLSEEERVEEFIMLSMRTSDGIDVMEFKNQFGYDYYARLVKNAMNILPFGNIIIKQEHICLTSQGIMTADQTILQLLK